MQLLHIWLEIKINTKEDNKIMSNADSLISIINMLHNKMLEINVNK